jgi:hypothetical protein
LRTEDFGGFDQMISTERPISNNPYSNKGKRKREKNGEAVHHPKKTKTSTPTKRTPPKRESKYSNVKKADQKTLNAMFNKVYGEKKTKKKK